MEFKNEEEKKGFTKWLEEMTVKDFNRITASKCPNCGSVEFSGNGDNTNDCDICDYHFHDSEIV